jgi:hypothetical protein
MAKLANFVWEHLLKPGGTDFATYAGDANAPTLYDYDKEGFIKPSAGRQITTQEQQAIDDYNKQRAALNDIERQQLDAEIKSVLPSWGTDPKINEPIFKKWNGSDAGSVDGVQVANASGYTDEEVVNDAGLIAANNTDNTNTFYLAPSLKDQGYTGATGTTPYKPADTQQLDALQNLYNNSPAANAPQVVSPTATVININFDGTKNNGQFPAEGESATNVFELTRLQREVSNPNNTIYLPGVGAQTVPTGTFDVNGNPVSGSSPSNWDSIPFNAGDIANGIVKDAYTQLTDRVGAILTENPNPEISLNLSGFSRGGAETVAFANYVNEHGIPGYCKPGECQIDSMVLFDPVDQTNGRLNTAPPTNVKSTFVMVAENEGRAIMPAMPVGPDAIVTLVPGGHADVGGSFNPDGVSAVTLKMARDFQEKSGVPVAEIPDSLAPNWEQMNVHNSGLDNYGNTVWSFNENYRGYEGAGFGSPSVQDLIRNGLPYVPSAENPAAGDALDYKVPADPSQPDGMQLTVREVTDRNGNSTLTVMNADGHVVMTTAPGDALMRDPSTGQFTLTSGVDGQISTYTPEVAAVPEVLTTPDVHTTPAPPAPDTPTSTDTSAHTNTNTFSNYLDAQGNALSSKQQDALATQIDKLGLGGEGELSFYPLPNGGALIANADGDIVGEINRNSATGDLQLKATAIDANGNPVEVNNHIGEGGDVQTQAQYTDAQTQQVLDDINQGIGLFNALSNIQNWDQLSDVGKLSAVMGLYNSVDGLGAAFEGSGDNLPGDLGAAASWLSLAQGLQSGDEFVIASGLNSVSDQALDGALNSAFGSTGVPYVSVVLALHNFEDNPAQSIGTLVGMYFGGPIGGAIGGFIGGTIGGMFGDDDIPMREGLAHAQWDANGHTQVLTTQDAEGGGATANSWMSSLVSGLQASLDHTVDANGHAQYGLVPNLLPSVGFKYDADGYNLANGVRGFTYLEWTDAQGQTQTRYYDGAGNRGDGSGETLSGDFVQHAQAAIAPAWQVQTVLAHYQQSGEIDLPAQTKSLPTELADGLHQTLQVISLELSSALPIEAAQNSKLIDVDGDGYLEQTQWLQTNQALLAVDLNGDGQIGLGETLNLQDADQVQHARTSMAWLDANGDGKLTAQDPAFAALKLWVDVNSDGKSANGELQTLSQAGITAIDFSTNPPSIERADGSQQALTVQTLTADTLGVALQQTTGGMLETSEQQDGSGTRVLYAMNTRAFDGQADSTHGGDKDVDGSNGDVVQLDASKLATTTNNTIGNSSTQTSTTVGVGDARLKSLGTTAAASTATPSTAATSAANTAASPRIAFVPTAQTSVQSEIRTVTDNMIESSQSLLFGGGSASLGVLAAVGTGATASAASASEVAQRVVSEVRSNDANGASPVATNPTSNNTFSTTATTTPNGSADTSAPAVTFKQVDLGVLYVPPVAASSTPAAAQQNTATSTAPTNHDTPSTTFVQATVIVSAPAPAPAPAPLPAATNKTAAPPSTTTTPAPEATPSVAAASSAPSAPSAPTLDYPQVQAETLPGTEDVVLRLNPSVLLANDSTPNASADPTQPALTITAVSAPLHGQVSLVNGEVLFAPDTNFHGTASFTYTVTDQYGLSSDGTATLQIAAVNDAPHSSIHSSLQQLSHRNPQGIGYFFNIVQRDIAHLSLNVRNESAVQISFKSQILLRPAERFALPHDVHGQHFACATATACGGGARFSRVRSHGLRVFKSPALASAVFMSQFKNDYAYPSQPSRISERPRHHTCTARASLTVARDRHQADVCAQRMHHSTSVRHLRVVAD